MTQYTSGVQLPPTKVATPTDHIALNGSVPNGVPPNHMTPHDQRRRAALLADSPELSSRPPLNAGGGSGSILGVLQNAHQQLSSSAGSSSSTTSSVHQNYGFDRVEVCLNNDSTSGSGGLDIDGGRGRDLTSPGGGKCCGPGGLCCYCYCKHQKCSRICSKLKQTFSGLTDSRVWKSFLLGQLISLLLCTIYVLCQILVENYNVKIPAGQNIARYILLAVTYLSLLCCQKHRTSLCSVFKRRGIQYFFLAVVDVESNYLIHRAFQYTTLTSVQLLDCFSIPIVLILSVYVLRARFRFAHIGGMALALMSVVVLVWVDIDDGKGGVSGGGKSRMVGDMLALGGSFLGGISHVGLEHSVQIHEAYELLGFLGVFGTLITAAQMALLERSELVSIKWGIWEVSVLLVALAVAQSVFYACLPHLLKMSSATVLNLSLLATDFYAIAAGIVFFHYKFNPLHFVAIALVILGFFIFSLRPVPYEPMKHKSVARDDSTMSDMVNRSLTGKSASPAHSQSSMCNGGTTSASVPLTALQEINYSRKHNQMHSKTNGRAKQI